MSQSLGSLLDFSTESLEAAHLQGARREAEYLLSAYLGVPRTKLLLSKQTPLTSQQIDGIKAWVIERAKRKPLAYVAGSQPFRDLDLNVCPSVLVPRPETELLVEECFKAILDRSEPVTAVDVGTGSGNIALSLAMHPQVKEIFAIDLSIEALAIAKTNAAKIRPQAPITWVQGNLFSPFDKTRLEADLVVANLPYIRSSDIEQLEPELHWEPRLALDGGSDGLRMIEPCIQQASFHLQPAGVLLLEIGFDQGEDVVKILEREKVWERIMVKNDLSRLPRFVKATRKE